MGRLVVENALLWDPESAGPAPGGLLVEGGRIAAKLPIGEAGPPDAARVDLGGRALGFITLLLILIGLAKIIQEVLF